MLVRIYSREIICSRVDLKNQILRYYTFLQKLSIDFCRRVSMRKLNSYSTHDLDTLRSIQAILHPRLLIGTVASFGLILFRAFIQLKELVNG